VNIAQFSELCDLEYLKFLSTLRLKKTQKQKNHQKTTNNKKPHNPQTMMNKTLNVGQAKIWEDKK